MKTNIKPNRINELVKEKELLEHFEYSDPTRNKTIFKDIEFYNRGKLSGESLFKYLDLLNVFNSGVDLSREQSIQLSHLLNDFRG